MFGLKRGYVGLFPGSAGALNLALMSNIGPDRPLVYGDPSYEQGPSVADLWALPKFAVQADGDLCARCTAMVAATPKAGAYYIVNPNNPTGTMTPKADIVWLLKNKPAGSVVIVDEAYHDFSNDESCIDLVAADQDIIVTRTFSKIYGMAGLRAGLVFARPDYFQKFRAIAPYAPSLASVSITSAAGGASGAAGQGPGPAAAQDQCGQPLGDAGVPDQARLHGRSRLAGELLHGGREAAGRRVPERDAGRECADRPHLGRDADLCARDRGHARTRWRSSRPHS